MGKQYDFTFTQMQPCTHIYLQVVGIHTCSTKPALTTTNHLSLSFSFTPQLICCGNNGYRKEIFSIILPIAWQKKNSRQKRREPESYYCQQFGCLLTVLGWMAYAKREGQSPKDRQGKMCQAVWKTFWGKKWFHFLSKASTLNSFRVILLSLWAGFSVNFTYVVSFMLVAKWLARDHRLTKLKLQ